MRSGGYFVAAILVALVVALGFAVSAGAGHAGDVALMKLLGLRESVSPDWLLNVAHGFTWLGDSRQRLIISLGLAAWLLWNRRFKAALVVAIVPTLGNAVSSILKEAFARERPHIVPHLDHVTNMAFPSGHAAAGAIFLFAALMLPYGSRALRLTVGGALMLLIGLSRPMLGVHWPTDVIGGWLLGLAFVVLGVTIIRNWEGAR